MPFVLDCSVAAAWALPDEGTPATEELLDRLTDDMALVPCIWPVELANVLLSCERRRRTTRVLNARFVDELAMLDIHVAPLPPDALARTLDLGREFGLTAHDALYLDLATREGLPLATLDDRLRQAALKMGVEVLV